MVSCICGLSLPTLLVDQLISLIHQHMFRPFKSLTYHLYVKTHSLLESQSAVIEHVGRLSIYKTKKSISDMNILNYELFYSSFEGTTYK